MHSVGGATFTSSMNWSHRNLDLGSKGNGADLISAYAKDAAEWQAKVVQSGSLWKPITSLTPRITITG